MGGLDGTNQEREVEPRTVSPHARMHECELLSYHYGERRCTSLASVPMASATPRMLVAIVQLASCIASATSLSTFLCEAGLSATPTSLFDALANDDNIAFVQDRVDAEVSIFLDPSLCAFS